MASGDFETILISGEAGIRKPDPAIFGRALQNLACEPPEAVFVGDHPEVDIAGAANAGLKTVWKIEKDYPGVVEADARLEHLAELPDILRRL